MLRNELIDKASPYVTPDGVKVALFAGKNSKTADHNALLEAIAMSKAGENRDHIWQKTGWGNFPDGKWRYELPGRPKWREPLKSRMLYDVLMFNTDPHTYGGKVKDFVDYPELLSAYPELARKHMKIRDYDAQEMPVITGRSGHTMTFVARQKGGDKRKSLNTLEHELNHDVEGIEGFSPGGAMASIDYIPDDLRKKVLKGMRGKPTAGMTATAPVIRDPHAKAKQGYYQYLTDAFESERDERYKSFSDEAIAKMAGMTSAEAEKYRTNVYLPEIDKLASEENPFAGDLLREQAKTQLKARAPSEPEPEPGAPSMSDRIWVYERLLGEVLSRVSAQRTLSGMTEEEKRQRPPWQDYDVPEGEIIPFKYEWYRQN